MRVATMIRSPLSAISCGSITRSSKTSVQLPEVGQEAVVPVVDVAADVGTVGVDLDGHFRMDEPKDRFGIA